MNTDGILQKPLDCACPAGFALSILDTLPGSVRMAGCMKCGRADLANPIMTEDQPHDVVFHGWGLCELTDEARAWASAWPRFTVVDGRRVYLAAVERYETEP